jgi:HlyD family secretion protein
VHRLTPWLAVILVLATACTSSPGKVITPTAVPTGKAVSAAPVRRGDIQQALSYSGDVRARDQVSVLPKASGRIQQLLVDTGSSVRTGDTLAILDQSSAQLSVAQASAALAVAQARLDTLAAGARVEDVAAARAALEQQQTRLQNMRAGGRVEDIRAAEAGLSAAQAQLQTAQAAHKQAQQPTQAAIAQAEAAVESARSQRAQAEAQQTALEQKAYGTLCSDVPVTHNSTACGDAKAAADVAMSAANAAVEAAQGQLDLLRRGGAPALQVQLQAAVDQAQAQSMAARVRLDALKNGGVAATRAQAEAQKQQAQGQLVQAQQALVAAQATLEAAQHGNLDAQVKNANAQVTAARERLKADQARTAAVHIQTGDASGQLRGGMFATLNIITADRHDALLVPRQSLVDGAVLTITPSGAVHRQVVKIGIQDERSIEILSGIDEGQLIATSGVTDLTEGEVVAPQIQAPMALSH